MQFTYIPQACNMHAVLSHVPNGAFIFLYQIVGGGCIANGDLSTLRALRSGNYWKAEIGKWVRTNFHLSTSEPTCIFSLLYTVLKISPISYPYRCFFVPSAQKIMGREKILNYRAPENNSTAPHSKTLATQQPSCTKIHDIYCPCYQNFQIPIVYLATLSRLIYI